MQRPASRLKVAGQCGAVVLFQEDLFGGVLVSDLDYTLNEYLTSGENVDRCQDDNFLSDFLTLGGSVNQVTNLETGEILSIVEQVGNAGAQVAVGSLQGGTACAGRVPLSTLHKSPFVEWASGAGLLKVSQGIKNDAPLGGKRGKIKGFSFASRRRLMQTIARIRFDAPLPMFVTLTYPDKFPSPIESKKHLDIYIKRLLRAFPDVGFIWKLEPQQRGAPHYHMLVYGVTEHDLFLFTVSAWYQIAGDGDGNHLAFHMGGLGNKPCVQAVYSREGVMRYASKYLGKTFEVAGWDEVYPGRFWAVVQKENIPFGQDMVMHITSGDAHTWMRYQRRFAKLKSRSYSSLTTFCNADKWTENIIKGKDNG